MLYLIVRTVEKPDDWPIEWGIALSVALFLTSACCGIFMGKYFYQTRCSAAPKLMGGMSSLIFEAALRSKDDAGRNSKSELNLVSSDVLMIGETVFWCPRLIGYSIMILSSIGLLVWAMGVSALFGVALMGLLMLMQGFMGGKQGQVAKQKQEATDDRVRIMRQAIVGMKVLKQNVWENSYTQKANQIREIELGSTSLTSGFSLPRMSFSPVSPA
jgi:ATP-binding cassette, subfamily C (CFTR/MRP), member 1